MALRKEAFNLRMQKATGQLTRGSAARLVRRGIARIKTIINERAVQTSATEDNGAEDNGPEDKGVKGDKA